MCSVPAPLGIGCSFFALAPEIVTAVRDRIDFVELSPDTLCQSVESDGDKRLEFLPELLEGALRVTDGLPVIVHGLELSIGSAAGWNPAYIELLDRFHAIRPFPWHSEHLGYMLAERTDGGRFHTGVPLPLPFTQEAVDCVAARADQLVQRYGVPFLLENSVYYLPDLPADPGWDEITFLNRLVEQSSCGLLLDVFNLYCNSVNHGFDLRAALARLHLDRVVEMHVAGGKPHDGFLLDSHSSVVPEPVWEVLEWLMPRTPNLAGMVYEVLDLDEAFQDVGADGLASQLDRLREVWALRARQAAA